jgi:hypothetical protein
VEVLPDPNWGIPNHVAESKAISFEHVLATGVGLGDSLKSAPALLVMSQATADEIKRHFNTPAEYHPQPTCYGLPVEVFPTEDECKARIKELWDQRKSVTYVCR